MFRRGLNYAAFHLSASAVIGSSLFVPPPPPPGPDDILKGYQWPASRLTKSDMMKLTELRAQLGLPITILLHEAISAYYHVLLAEAPASDAATPPIAGTVGR